MTAKARPFGLRQMMTIGHKLLQGGRGCHPHERHRRHHMDLPRWSSSWLQRRSPKILPQRTGAATPPGPPLKPR
eukprot:3934735-Alexandrium_andersonii.AAC.1